MKGQEDFYGVSIPTYVINIKEREDRLAHIQKQFEAKPEFNVTVINAIRHEIGAVGLWLTILEMIKLAKERNDDVIIMCEDDHEFTQDYNKNFLIEQIIEGNQVGLNLLFGGLSGFNQVVRITKNRYWVDSIWGCQFVIIYSRFFDSILKEVYQDSVTADGKFSEMTSLKMFVYPFISIQKDFGYSDVTESNNQKNGLVTKLFNKSNQKMTKIVSIYKRYIDDKSK